MLQLDVHNMAGKKVDSLSIDEAVFGGAVNAAVLRDAILMYQANGRSGTASAKNRVDVHGARKKPFRQKGTGRARQGSWLSPHHRGGGVAHGPRPRSYRQSMPKKARLAALKSAYLDKLQTATHIVDSLQLDVPKTKEIAQLLRNLNVEGTCLIATFASPEAVVKSVRNIPGVEVKRIRDVNAYDLVRPRHLVVTRRALETLVERFAGDSDEGGRA
jgi:large subunit ribosomal protein L4